MVVNNLKAKLNHFKDKMIYEFHVKDRKIWEMSLAPEGYCQKFYEKQGKNMNHRVHREILCVLKNSL